MRRANNVISLSLIVMTVTFVLATSIGGMVLHVTVTPARSICFRSHSASPHLRPSCPAERSTRRPQWALSDYILSSGPTDGFDLCDYVGLDLDNSLQKDERTADNSASELDNHKVG